MDEQATPKIKLSIKPPLPNSKCPLSPRSPTLHASPSDTQILRRSSNMKIIHKRSTEKSIRQRQMERNIKYSRPKAQIKNEISFIQSEKNSGAIQPNNKLTATRESLSKNVAYSGEKMQRRQNSIRLFDSVSGLSNANVNRGCGQKGEEYYVYWKNKAHEYLEANMKLMEQISKLTRENQTLQQAADRLKREKQLKQVHPTETHTHSVELIDLRPITLHYLTKIQELQKQLRRKDNMLQIASMRISELTQTIAGDKERIKLISILKTQIETLKQQNGALFENSKAFRIEESNRTTSESFGSPHRAQNVPAHRHF